MRRSEALAEEAVEKRCEAEERGRPGADAAEAVESPDRQRGSLLHGGDRRHPGGAKRRPKAGEQSDEDADDERDDDRAGLDRDAVVGQREADCIEELEQTLPQSKADEETDDRREDAHHEGFEDHAAQHLPSRRAERPQSRELARALRDGDRERIGNDERADEERDARERE